MNRVRGVQPPHLLDGSVDGGLAIGAAWAAQDSPDRDAQAERLLALLLHGLRSPGGDVLHPQLAQLDQDG